MGELREVTAQIARECSGDLLWSTLDKAGLTRVGLPEELGGSGGSLADAAEIVLELSRHRQPVPVAESMLLCGQLAAQARLRLPEGIVSCAFHPVPGKGLKAINGPDGWRVEGFLGNVPWAKDTAHLLVLAATPEQATIAGLLAREHYDVAPQQNQVTILPRAPLAQARVLPEGIALAMRLGALARSVQAAGTMQAVLTMTAAYVGQRHQFGRPLSQLQVVRQQLAVMAGEVTAASTAAAAAISRPTDTLAVAAAKVQTAISSTTVARIAHQLHGAMGVTQEYPLHHFTSRLWAWRGEYGSEDHWARQITRIVGTQAPWPALTGRAASGAQR